MPQKIDLSKMNLAELKDLRKSIDKAMADAEKASRKKALEEVQKAAAIHGFALGDLVEGKRRRGKPKAKAAPKYRNPADASQTWSGRGRQPEWFKSAVAGGTDPEKLKI